MTTRFLLILSFFLFPLFSSCGKSDSPVGNEKEDIDDKDPFLAEHPRLLFSAAEEERVRELMVTDPLMKELSVYLREEAQKLIGADQYPYKTGTSALLTAARDYVYRLITLSLAYRMFEEQSFLKESETILEWICKYPDWNKVHFLDTAEMTIAVSIAYDWLYHDLSPEIRQKAKNCILQHALLIALKEYKNGDEGSWAKRETNWNVVCNTGMSFGALAISEDYPDLAKEIIDNAVKYIPNCLKHFQPDGVCYEGPSYWEYTTMHLAMFLKLLNDNFKTDYGLGELPGISKTARYYVNTVSPSDQVFNFADSPEDYPVYKSPVFFFYSKYYNQPEVASWYRALIQKHVINKKENPKWHFFLCIPWYDNAPSTVVTPNKLQVFYGVNDIFVFNGDTAAGSLFLVGKGADPDMAHQHLDGGSFMIESEGVRWTDETGAEKYNLPGFWDYSASGLRWSYFRNTNQAHNTVTINDEIQYPLGRAFIKEADIQSEEPQVVLEMTTLYPNTNKFTRTFKQQDANTIVLTDDITLLSTSDIIRWSIVTKKTVKTDENRAILTSGDKKLYLTILEPQGAKFFTKEAETNSANEKPIHGFTLLQFEHSGERINALKVKMSSIND